MNFLKLLFGDSDTLIREDHLRRVRADSERMEAANTERKQQLDREITEKHNRYDFYSCFSTSYEKSKEHYGQINIMFKLNILAAHAKSANQASLSSPGNSIYLSQYNDAVSAYDRAIHLVRFFNEDFGKLIPHWTRFSEFYKNWAIKNNVSLTA